MLRYVSIDEIAKFIIKSSRIYYLKVKWNLVLI